MEDSILVYKDRAPNSIGAKLPKPPRQSAMDSDFFPKNGERRRPYVIVLGNEKGGTGKSTTAMHLIVALLGLGYAVGSIDLDSRQGTLSRYIENRGRHVRETGRMVAMPRHHRIHPSDASGRQAAETDERIRLHEAFANLSECDIVIIDTPGADSHLSRLGHVNADTLITPVNDSFVDIDVIALIDREKREVQGPSFYSKLVWEQNNRRIVVGRPPIDWVVLRNRLTHIDARNKRDVEALLRQLAVRIGFRLAPGFGERVVFRELFLKGLTVLDPVGDSPEDIASPSHEAGRREIEAMMEVIGLPLRSEQRDRQPA